MSRIRGKNTAPELQLHKLLRNAGIKGFHRHSRLQGKPDFFFTKEKLAVFVDGCFWHKCPECFIKPTTHTTFWVNKITNNSKRDKITNKTLSKSGLKVMRVWEHELTRNSAKIIKKIIQKLNR